MTLYASENFVIEVDGDAHRPEVRLLLVDGLPLPTIRSLQPVRRSLSRPLGISANLIDLTPRTDPKLHLRQIVGFDRPRHFTAEEAANIVRGVVEKAAPKLKSEQRPRRPMREARRTTNRRYVLHAA